MFGLNIGVLNVQRCNETGGRTQYDCKTRIDKTKNKSHFISSSQVMKPSWKVELSSIGCLTTILIITYTNTWYWYIGPYFIVNAWLVLYTFLHHTHTPRCPTLWFG